MKVVIIIFIVVFLPSILQAIFNPICLYKDEYKQSFEYDIQFYNKWKLFYVKPSISKVIKKSFILSFILCIFLCTYIYVLNNKDRLNSLIFIISFILGGFLFSNILTYITQRTCPIYIECSSDYFKCFWKDGYKKFPIKDTIIESFEKKHLQKFYTVKSEGEIFYIAAYSSETKDFLKKFKKNGGIFENIEKLWWVWKNNKLLIKHSFNKR